VGALLLGALWTLTSAAQAPAADSGAVLTGVKTIENPGGGRIYLGKMAGQPTPPEAMGKVMQRVTALCGDRPQLGKLVKNSTGEILAGFFSVTGTNLDGKPMEGLAIVYAPKSGTAGGAVLLDDASRFPTTVNPMFALLKQQLGAAPSNGTVSKASAGSAKTAASSASSGSAKATAPAKAQPLESHAFPDGTGSIGLPAGWQVQHAQSADVIAGGPHGETLRFGWMIPAVNRSGTGPGNFVAIPYSTDPADAFKAAITQVYEKSRKTAPAIDISKVQEIPISGGKNEMLYGTIDVRNGKGQQYLVRRKS
jgi:hypothetical protein